MRHSGVGFDWRFLARAIALAGTVVAVSVCGEQGRFGGTTGPGGPGVDATPPRVTNTIADPVVEITDSLRFTVQASDSTRLKKVTVVVAGLGTFAASLDSTLTDSTFSTTTAVLSFAMAYVVPLPSNAAGQRIIISASAEDGNANVGYDTDTVTVNDGQPPAVTLLSPAAGTLVGAGERISIIVRSQDPSLVLRAGARLFLRDTVLQRVTTLAADSLVFTTFRTSRTDTFHLTVPATLRPGSYLVQGFAVDNSPSHNGGASTPDVAISVRDVQPPFGSFLSPAVDAQVVAGDTVTVQFRAQDSTGVSQVVFSGYSLRGNPSLGTDTTVVRFQSRTALLPLQPADTQPIIRLLPAVTSDSTAEYVFLKASITDVGGNVTTLTRRIQVVGGPFVKTLSPAAGARPQTGVTVSVIDSSYSPYLIDSVGFRSRGAVTTQVTVAKAGGPTRSVDTLAFVVPAGAPLGTADTITPFAWDRRGIRIWGAPVVVSFVDLVAPAVTLQGPTLVDTAVSAGDSLLVQFRVQDTRGVAQVTVEGFALRGDSALGTNTEFARYGTKTVDLPASTDTTLRRYLMPDSTYLGAERAFVRVTARDSAGNATTPPAVRRFQIIGGASVRLQGLSSGLTHPVGSSLAVLVQGSDPDSVARLGFVSSGAITARDSTVFTSPLGTSQSASLSLTVPNAATVGAPDTIIPFIVDRLGNRTLGAAAVISFADSTLPAVTFVSPTSDTGVVAGDSVLIRVRLQDNRRGLNARITGGSWFGAATATGLNSADTTVGRYLLFTGNIVNAPDTALIVATVTDGAGLSTVDTLRIQVTSGPFVRISSPANGARIRLGQGGVSLLPVVSAFHPDTIAYLGFQATGRVTKSDSVAATRPMTTLYLAQQLNLLIPDTTRLGAVVLTPFVRLKSGVRLTGPAVTVELIDGSLPVVRLLAPARAGTDQLAAGDSLLVRVAVSDDQALASLRIEGFARRPDVWPDSLGQVNPVLRYTAKTVEYAQSVRDTVVRYLNAVLADSTAENVYVVATVTDRAGNTAVDTVKVLVISGPRVSLTAPLAGALRPVGTTLSVTVNGSDPHTLTYVGYAATGMVAQADSVAIAPAAAAATRTLSWSVPATAGLGAEELVPFARNATGLRFTGAPVTIVLVDTVLPSLTFLGPAVGAPVVAGDSVLVTMRVRDNRGLDSVSVRGVAHPGIPTLGADTNISRYYEKTIGLRGTGLVDTTLTRYLLPLLTDSTAETVYLVARVRDVQGNVKAESVTVSVAPGPYAAVIGLQTGTRVPVGSRLTLSVAGYDPDTLAYIGYEATGRFPWADSIQIVRPVPDAVRAQNTLDFWIPLTAALGVDTIRPFARDIFGGRFYGPPVVIHFTDNSNPLVDIIRPDSGGLDAIAASDSLFVRFRARDNQGVLYVGAFGRWNYPANGDSTGRHTSFYPYLPQTGTVPAVIDPLEFSKFRINPMDADTMIRVFLQPTQVLADSAPRSVWIIALAQDSAGNVGMDSVQLNVTAGAYVRITSPASPLVHPTATPVSVTVTAFDPDSIIRVGILASGSVTSGDSVSYSSPLALTQTTTRTISVPGSVTGSFTITPFAVDRFNNRRLGSPLLVQLADTARPTVTIDTPSVALYPVASGDSVYVRVHVQDSVGVARVTLTGVARRGNVALGTDTVVTRFRPKTVTLASKHDTTLTRYLLPDTGQAISEVVYVVVTAEDSSGNASSDTASIRIVGGPVMSVVRPAAGATTSVGKSVIIELYGVDNNGVRLMGWRATGVLTAQDSGFFSPVSGNLADTATFTDTLIIPALTPLGTFTITPFGLDSLGDVSGTVPGVSVTVQSSAGDVTPPTVTFQIGRRIEIDDSVTVGTTDAGGIRNLGFRVTTLDTTNILRFDTLGANLNGTLSDVSRTFTLNLPVTLRYPAQVIVRGYGTDSTGNHSFSPTADTLTVVAGRTYSLPAGSQIADAIYNQRRRELYLSNYTRDRIEVFSLQSNSFVASIPVGSKPWGLAMWPRAHNTGTAVATDTIYADTLIVANSGGTNFSIVDLVRRREERRHRLPNYVVQKIKIIDNGNGGVSLQVTDFDMSDRPQYVGAVCRAGGATGCDSVIAVYSTTPTGGQSAPNQNRGYLAWENISATGRANGHIFWEQAFGQATNSQDTVQIFAIRDTIPGQAIRDTIVGGAAGMIIDFARLVFQDTTYVRNSGNFLRSVIGEGGGGLGLARVLSYDVTSGMTTYQGRKREVVTGIFLDSLAHADLGISAALQVQDFIGNRASSVTAVATNFTGGTNLIRADSIYVFDALLRQTGMLQVSGQAHGMDLAPLHAFTATDTLGGTDGVAANGDADSRIVFAARPDSSIDVFDTYFFGEVTDTTVAGVPIPIRNALVGAVRITPDSGGTVLTGITNQGLVVVRLPHLTNPFPTQMMRPEVALPRPRRAVVPRTKGASPPNE